jgi:hypothetical protein
VVVHTGCRRWRVRPCAAVCGRPGAVFRGAVSAACAAACAAGGGGGCRWCRGAVSAGRGGGGARVRPSRPAPDPAAVPGCGRGAGVERFLR